MKYESMHSVWTYKKLKGERSFENKPNKFHFVYEKVSKIASRHNRSLYEELNNNKKVLFLI